MLSGDYGRHFAPPNAERRTLNAVRKERACIF
jgi:hypothetical protein